MRPRLGELPTFLASVGGGGGDVRTAWTFFLTIAALLLVFMAIVAGVMVSRHVRRSLDRDAAGEEPDRPETPNPWREAGRRAKPYPKPPGPRPREENGES